MSSVPTDFDIVILGAGPVGQSCALLLALHWSDPARIAIVDAKPAADSARDPRTLALSYGSRQLLERIHAWPQDVVTPIETIHISHRGHFGRTLIRHDEYGLPALGYTASYGALLAALQTRLEASGIDIRRPVKATACTEADDGVRIDTDHGPLTAQLAIHAEGGLFGQPSDADVQRDFAQQAIVSVVQCDRAQTHTAFERFTAQGPLALLPVQQGYALVWCCAPERAHTLRSCPEAEFLAALQNEFGQRVGRFAAVAARHAFPLGMNVHATLTQGRSVRIGNAAQTLHPVAGQGLNLGLRDALTLVNALEQSPSPEQALQEYTKQRQLDRGVTSQATGLLARLFVGNPWATAALAGAGLTLLDLAPTLKKPLAQQMMFGQR
ncbi:MAG: 2-octaprenyl-6-methoxyphenyl hydroxylase [Burkholderiaceae bacterium]|nr:MAG: 2-octaprenyl-6-methoxyphenyl hydroxylase [Burkholderiaceae bacterium]